MELRDSCAWVLTAALLTAGLGSGCCPDLPSGTSSDEASSAGITQGVVGKAVARTGECSQCGLAGCSVENIDADFLFVAADVSVPVRSDAGECFVQLGSRRQGYLGRPVRSGLTGTTSVSLTSGSFAAQLDAGTYWVVLQRDGCGVCFGSSEIEGANCSQMTVQPDAVSTYDLIVDVSY